MIISFSVQNFGSIKEKQTLSFEADKSDHLEDYYVIQAPNGMRLLKLAMIYGANASGKTTVLKALDFLRDLVTNPKEKKTDALNFEPFLFDFQTPKQNSFFTLDFIVKHIRYTYEIEFNRKCVVSEKLVNYDPKKAIVYKRDTNIEKQLTEITFGSKLKKGKEAIKSLEANTLWNNTVLGGFLKTNVELDVIKEISNWLQYGVKDLISNDSNLKKKITPMIVDSFLKKSLVVEILKKADFNVSDILFKEKSLPKPLLEYIESNELSEQDIEAVKKYAFTDTELEHSVNGVKYKLPFNIESKGTQRYYGLSGILSFLLQYPSIQIIDELEDSLHPDLYNHFLLTFLVNAKNSQLITTTHNREILKDKNIFRNDAIWFTDKSNESCATELYSLADFDSSVVRDTSNVYNAYKIGKLGGVPNLGDYYIDLEDEKE